MYYQINTNFCEKMTSQDKESDFPTEHIKTVQNFQTSLSELDTVLKDLFDVPLSEIHETKATTPLDKAKLDIISAFALNSLTWMWLRTQGTNPKETEVGILARLKNWAQSYYTS